MIFRFDHVVNVIVVKDKHKNQPLNIITQGQTSKVALPRLATNVEQATTSTHISKYSPVNQLLKTPTHISIFYLLQISLEHKEILTQSLVPNNLDVNRF